MRYSIVNDNQGNFKIINPFVGTVDGVYALTHTHNRVYNKGTIVCTERGMHLVRYGKNKAAAHGQIYELFIPETHPYFNIIVLINTIQESVGYNLSELNETMYVTGGYFKECFTYMKEKAHKKE